MQIHLIVLGKLKEKYWQDAENEYLKRLQPWGKIELHELKEESFSEKDKPELIKKKEAEKIKSVLEKISAKGDMNIIALDEHGKQFSSVQFANQFSQFQQASNLVFIIGGPLGLDESILSKSNLKLSLGTMTFTHQMARIFLLEQIYRAFMINQNRKYHY